MEMFNKISEKFRSNEPIQVQVLINEGDELQEDNYLKNSSANRSRTDVLFLIIHGVLLGILVIILGYVTLTADIDRITKGYDDCGNVCGKNNNFDIRDQTDCKAVDMTHKPFLSINKNNRECVENCQSIDGYRCVTNQVEPEEKEIEEFIKGFSKCVYNYSYEIAWLAVIALAFAFVILLVLRYAAAVFVWFTLFGMVLAFTALAVYFGKLSAAGEDTANSVRAAILYGIIAVGLLAIIFSLRKYIELLIQLFKEAGKAVMAMPILLFEPTLTFLSLAAIWSAWIYFSLWIESMGRAEEFVGKVTFIKTAFVYLVELYHIFIMLWMVQFVCGCQNMLIAGAVSSWYFTRNKCKLDKPICTSAKNLIKYHLGTVSVTSLIMAALQFVKVLILMLRRVLRYAVCITYCLNYVQQWMRYYTKNSCIITAMHGHNFREAGSRAFKLIVENIIQIVTINAVGDWVLVLAKVLVATCTVGISGVMIPNNKATLTYGWALFLLIGFMAFMIAHCFFSVYEAAIDTIFICFCEDREINDGISRPYYMSSELNDFIEKSKVIVIVKTSNNTSMAA